MKLFALVAFSVGVYLALQRNTYLPFLGMAAVPPTVLKDTAFPSHSNNEVELSFENVPNGSKVIYWGAKPAATVQSDPQSAYADFSNAGVAVIVNGKATLRFACPSKYQVGTFHNTLNRHIHYRISHPNGMLGSVKTKYIKC